MTEAARTQNLNTIWNHTHADFKSTGYGFKAIMICRAGMTMLVTLTDLTDKEIADRLPKAA